MSFFFIGQITQVGFPYAPKSWADCDGKVMSIGQNQALYALIGTQFGGDGRTTFALPDLRGRVPVGTQPSAGYPQGLIAGSENVTLTLPELATHSHAMHATSGTADRAAQNGSRYLGTPADNAFGPATNLVPMATNAVSTWGQAAQPHSNVQPSTVIRFIIALYGIFPSRN